MNATTGAKPPLLKPAVSQPKVMRRLFLTLFLRGRSARGLRKTSAPQSIGSKLALTLVVYALFGGMIAAGLMSQAAPVFVVSLFLHSATVVFLGMFVASSAGEVLFNKEEADILLHRPVSPRTMLWAKVRVLVEVSLWLAGAFNLAGFFVGAYRAETAWLYPVAHAMSTTLEALFCTGSVVLIYQLCLRWFGRERLDGLMTTAQVFFAIAVVVGGQVVPRLMFRYGRAVGLSAQSWWVSLLPPAWFAGFDDALSGSGASGSWVLAGVGLAATAGVLWIAFGKLAEDYETGLQRLGETVSRPKRSRTSRRWADALAGAPPMRWWLRDSVSRASFLLVAAYLARDRDVKLRVYPALAPMMVMPVIFLLPSAGGGGGFGGGFGIAFASAYLGMVPMMSLNLLQYSQQWQASDIFRAAPMAGPMALCNGARRAVLCFLTLPLLAVFAGIAWLIKQDASQLVLLLPGVLLLPVYALVPCLLGEAVPLSKPTEEAKSTARGMVMLVMMVPAFALSGIAYWAWSTGWFWWLVMGETLIVAVACAGMRASLASLRWSPAE